MKSGHRRFVAMQTQSKKFALTLSHSVRALFSAEVNI
nr:MAG TPA: hypothetical protein [Caudoviricetes sp.]